MTEKTLKAKYLIIGNSAGGIGAAEAIRAADKAGSIIIVSDEPYPAYSRPLISEYLAEKCSLERMLFRPADFYQKNNIDTITGNKVKRLDAEGHTVELESGGKIAWEKLLIATGGVPIVPPTPGMERKGVFSFTTLDDAKAIDQYLDNNKVSRAVVIGGGFIGASVTEALAKRKIEVTIIEMKERILNTLLDETASALAEGGLRRAGVNVVTCHTVAEIGGDTEGEVGKVTLDDGRQIPCELVVVAIGVRPRTELVSATSVKVNRGIVVDRYMATSNPDIYACGDAAEAFDSIYGENRVTPIWPNAYIGGRTAGFNMAGVAKEYPSGTAMNSLKYFGLDIVAAGMVNYPNDGYEELNSRNGDDYRKIVLKDGLLVGMVFVGNIEKSGVVYGLMKDGVNVDSFKQVLVTDSPGLLSLPEELWRKRLETSITKAPSLVASAATEADEGAD